MSQTENNSHLIEEQLRTANETIIRLRKEAATAKELSAAAIEKKALEQTQQRSQAIANERDLHKEMASLKQALAVANQSLIDQQDEAAMSSNSPQVIKSLQSQLLALQSKCDTYVVELVMERKEAKSNQRTMDKIREEMAAEKAQWSVDRAQLQMEMEQMKQASTAATRLKVRVTWM